MMSFVSSGSLSRLACVSGLGLAFLACSSASSEPTGEDGADLSANGTCGSATENQTTTLSCPSGTISKVVFASYGRPRGACGSYAQRSCHSATSRSAVEKACLGKADCTLRADNTTFGDPCVGVDKRLYVQIECAAGGTGSPPPPAPAPAPDGASPPATVPDGAPTPSSVLPVPTGIASGATVSLNCGQAYQGTLDLKGKSNVTVKTAGTCGKASITPGRAVTGWQPYSGKIYSAPIGFNPVQVAVSGKPVDAAHWPNRPQIWAAAGSSLPSSDLAGATLVYLQNQSVIATKPITGNSVSTSLPFYVEGKLWMLDVPGEWAVSNGRLYMWAPDGLSPEGRVWAAPNSNGIDADNSSNITVDGVRIFAARDGISANTSSGLHVLNSEIINSTEDGIWASGSTGMQVDKTSVVNSRGNGIDGWYSVTGATVTNSTVVNTGTVGMPSPTGAGVFFGDGSTNRIDNVRVTNSGYHGISVLHNRHTTVSNSVVEAACVTLTDCAGIYTGARDKLPLDLHIESNKVNNVGGSEGIAIYLDDFANGVTVTKNTISNSTSGMVVHNGFDNVITYNTFVSSKIKQLVFAQDTGNIRNNQVTHNTFKSTSNEFAHALETGQNLKTFATYDYNTYTSTNPSSFGRLWDGSSPGVTLSYASWKSYMGQDAHSTMNGAP
jgi:parallel beta-helix repeat protein